ncbi:ribose 5-phosphate isomerase B [Candidatus Enterococcus willemsii]|uniref:Ribose 5-phosphate isomerase B n=1 Tax=Candidatus Enterococcus willemsii TaxID=1857215 RepID=A0ABQ6Z0G4_9ENTE|nr:ribose 5-phosphate isomerase B [Enterococcus sp. CU12B]KAF1304459.1 ribose 5-phosphate isomerase B [Enterococcus sp. CU12B]
MKIAIASDHNGFELKEVIKAHLSEREVAYEDFGTKAAMVSVDYPKYTQKVVEAILRESVNGGILICDTGIGMSITANKSKGIRAAVVGDVYSAKVTKEHNNANIICLGQRVIGDSLAQMIVDAWLDAEFQGEPHQNRIAMIEK